VKSLLLLAVAACACPEVKAPRTTPAAPRAGIAALGETLTLDSKILGERRVINVYVPPGYSTSSDRYPVLYMPDGGMAEDFPHVVGSVDVSIKNAVIRPLIVVGIENTERRRDLPGPTVVPDEQKAAPHAGGNDTFRAFLRDELKPMIAARYRTTNESALIGESFAGLFVVDTLLVEPTLFDGYIAADPSLWWNQQSLVNSAGARLAAWSAGAKILYIATGDAKEMADGVAILQAALTANPRVQIALTYERMPHEHHSTIFPTAALHGIRLVFAAPTRE
jgi:uncharacterized protein